MAMQGSSVLPSAAADTISTSEPSLQSKREDWRKAKELEEARKAGTAPALTDEEGRLVLVQGPFLCLCFQLNIFFRKQNIQTELR